MTLWSMSLTGGCIIVVTALLRALFHARLPRRLFLALWALALIRLLIPYSFPSPLNIRAVWTRLSSLTACADISQDVDALPPEAFTQPDGVPSDPSPLPAGPDALPDGTHGGAARWPGVLYGVGVCALAVYFTAGYVYSRRKFSGAAELRGEEVSRFLALHPLRRRVTVRRSEHTDAPLTYGVLRPVILLPARSAWAEPSQVSFILLHEWIHIRRFDALTKQLLALALCVHWFNPLVWVLFVLANRDMELCCDEAVLRALGAHTRRDYALTLLHLEAKRSGLTSLLSHLGQNALEERIFAMTKYKKTTFSSLVAAALLFCFTTAAFATSEPAAPRAVTQPSHGIESGSIQEGRDLRIAPEEWEAYYSRYEPFGLVYHAEDGRIYFAGKKVRYLEDMYPVDLQGRAGTVLQFPDGEIDVYAMRDLSGPIQRNEDGSFDPSGTLTGLRAATQEEFDALSAHLKEVASYPSAQVAEDIHWWTAPEYEAWLENEKKALQALADEGARAYTQSDGWFTWTQERVDQAVALYEETLNQLRNGASIGYFKGTATSPSGSIGIITEGPAGALIGEGTASTYYQETSEGDVLYAE